MRERREILFLAFAALACAAFALGGCAGRDESAPTPPPAPAPAAPKGPGFLPKISRYRISATEARPDTDLVFTWWVTNAGSDPAPDEYKIFIHVEWPDADCSKLVWQDDHYPKKPTTLWAPGEETAVGPRILHIPSKVTRGKVYVHCGIFAEKAPGQPRILSEYVCAVEVDPDAPVIDSSPAPITADEAAARRKALDDRFGPDSARLSAATCEFRLDPKTGAYCLSDELSHTIWHSDPRRNLMAELTLKARGKTVAVTLAQPHEVEQAEDRMVLNYSLDSAGSVRMVIEKVVEEDGLTGLRFTPSLKLSPGYDLSSMRLLPGGFWMTDSDSGELTLPNMLGLQIKVSECLPWELIFGTYQGRAGLSMAMAGCHKLGSALLLTWNDPYAALETRSEWVSDPAIPGAQMVSAGFMFTNKARDMSVTAYPLGMGGAPRVAHAYRAVARRKGYLTTWKEKAQKNPNALLMPGCADFKPFVFMRTIREGGRNSVSQWFTFKEAAACAEHLRKDVGIDRAMYVLAGWIHRGYDNQHPDIMPAAPECGGNEALADCARRVKAQGYLFGLHDNYQDMYKDAPSFDEKWLVRWPGGIVARGGYWAGGQAYQVCSLLQPVLASRPQNFPAVKSLCSPTIYFSDTVFAWPLVECSDQKHPMSRHEDMDAKRQLCALARENFGLFGSEDGYEWAIPVSDYHEGIIARSPYSDKGRRIPLYEMVYHDCIAAYTHQSDRLAPGRPDYFLDCLLYGEMPVYYFGPRLYYQDKPPGRQPLSVEVASVAMAAQDRLKIAYRWRCSGDAAKVKGCFVHFVPPGEDDIAIQNDHAFAAPASEWKDSGVFEDGPHEVKTGGKKGRFAVLAGVLDESRNRMPMRGRDVGDNRYLLGHVVIDDGKATYAPASDAGEDSDPFGHDEGAVEGMHPTDRLIRNTYEVLTWVGRLSGDLPMRDFRFLSEDGNVAQSSFGAMTITVNYSARTCELVDIATLPPYGFLVEHPMFTAFYANSYRGQTFAEPTMATIRSLDDKPLSECAKVRFYRARGDRQLRFRGGEYDVEGALEVGVMGPAGAPLP
ncbi:MAG TPA: DUF5696 domain-containing protein [Candidatus Brocadiia bacterium]|nr:DUF5696 domain-containing protein [Candidatus Brocadiia bacterium]